MDCNRGLKGGQSWGMGRIEGSDKKIKGKKKGGGAFQGRERNGIGKENSKCLTGGGILIGLGY